MRTVDLTIGLMAMTLVVGIMGSMIEERPNLGPLVCTDTNGRYMHQDTWYHAQFKECHRPRSLWVVAFKGW